MPFTTLLGIAVILIAGVGPNSGWGWGTILQGDKSFIVVTLLGTPPSIKLVPIEPFV